MRLTEHVRPDLALVDLHLRDGASGATVARELMLRWNTPSLFLSGDEAVRANQDAGIGFIENPIELEAMLSCIRLSERLIRGEKLASRFLPKEPPESDKRRIEAFRPTLGGLSSSPFCASCARPGPAGLPGPPPRPVGGVHLWNGTRMGRTPDKASEP